MKFLILLLALQTALQTAMLAAPSDPTFTNPKIKGLSAGADSNTNILKVDATTGVVTRVTIPAPDLSTYLLSATAATTYQPLDSDLTSIAALSTAAFGRGLLSEASASSTKTTLSLVKADVGLGNVDNTADTAKPVSTAQQTALNLKANLAGCSFTGPVIFVNDGPEISSGASLYISSGGTFSADTGALFTYGAGTAAAHRTALNAPTQAAIVTFSNAPYTITATTTVFVAQIGTLSASRTVTLPAASTFKAGDVLTVMDKSGTCTSANTIVIARAGADTIDGATSVTIAAAYGWRRFISDGVSQWSFDGGVLRSSNNLSDLSSAATARTNLGITSIASVTSGAGVETFLATPSSANLATAVTDETGTGALMFGTSPLVKTNLRVRNPGDTFSYTLTPAAIAADRILNLPLTTATDTLATLGLSQTFTGAACYITNGGSGGTWYSYASGAGKYLGINATGMKLFTISADDINITHSTTTVHTTFQASGNVLKTTGGRIKLVTVDTGTSLTLTNANHVVTCSNAGAVTVNLPAGVTGTEFTIKNKGAGTVTIDPNAAQELFTTTNVGTLALTTGQGVIIIWDGTHWSVVSNY